MRRKPAEYLKEPYARILIPDEKDTFSAEIMEFPGCFSQGETADEALRNLERAAISWIEAALNQGQEIPPPSMNQGYGGRIALRLPRSIHRRASELAERDNTSLNQFILSAVAARIGAEDFCAAVARKLEFRIVAAASTIMLGASSRYRSLQDQYSIDQINTPLIPKVTVGTTIEAKCLSYK